MHGLNSEAKALPGLASQGVLMVDTLMRLCHKISSSFKKGCEKTFGRLVSTLVTLVVVSSQEVVPYLIEVVGYVGMRCYASNIF